MRAALLLVFGWLLLTLQTSLLYWMPGVPAFFVPLSLYFGATRAPVRAALLAGALGYFADLLGGGPRGMNAFLAMLLAIAASAASLRFVLRGAIVMTVLSFLGALFAQLLALGMLMAFYRDFELPDLVLGDILPIALATALFGGPTAWLCRHIDELGKKVQRQDALLR